MSSSRSQRNSKFSCSNPNYNKNDNGEGDDSVGENAGENDTFCWRKFLTANPENDIMPAPVWAFHYAPLRKIWDQIEITGVKVEYKLGNVKGRLATYGNVFWIGSIKSFFGYMVKVQAQGYPANYSGEPPVRWMNYITDCFRIGTCGSINDATLIPPLEIMQLEKDWRNTVVKEITGEVTIHPRIRELLEDDKEKLLHVGAAVEALDNLCISRMRVGTVNKSIGGRVHIRYWDAAEEEGSSDSPNEAGFWCHLASGWVVPRGWSKLVGHDLSSPEGYNPPPMPVELVGGKDPGGIDIQIGMKLEAIDPVNPSVISAATVVKILNFGYIMISFDGPSEENNGDSDIKKTESSKSDNNCDSNHGNDWFCYHITSRMIFPCGFCDKWGIDWSPPGSPKDYVDQPFNWKDYFAKTGALPLDLEGLHEPGSKEGFKVGMKLEAADMIDPSLICISTITDIKDRLLRVHFDGWTDEYDQWMDMLSPDIFPIGWCDANGYALQAPKGKTFWKNYIKPDANINIRRTFAESDEYKPQLVGRRGPGRPKKGALVPESVALQPPEVRKALKRKASDSFTETLIHDHSKSKAEAFKPAATKLRVNSKSLEQIRKDLQLKKTGPPRSAESVSKMPKVPKM